MLIDRLIVCQLRFFFFFFFSIEKKELSSVEKSLNRKRVRVKWQEIREKKHGAKN